MVWVLAALLDVVLDSSPNLVSMLVSIHLLLPIRLNCLVACLIYQSNYSNSTEYHHQYSTCYHQYSTKDLYSIKDPNSMKDPNQIVKLACQKVVELDEVWMDLELVVALFLQGSKRFRKRREREQIDE